MADLYRTSGATKAAVQTMYMQPSLLKVEISSTEAEMTEDNTAWVSSSVLRCSSVCKHSPARGGDPVLHCDSGVFEAGMPIHSVALYSYGQVAFEQWRYWIVLSKAATGAMA